MKKTYLLITAALCAIFIVPIINEEFYPRQLSKSIQFLQKHGLDKKILLDYFPMQEKFWLHRADSVEKIREKKDFYPGLEIDIQYHSKEKVFDVNHDWYDSVGLPLDLLLDELSGGPKRIWLDYKNLQDGNAEESFQTLTGLLDKYGIKRENVIVESPNFMALNVFHEGGLYTSYYVPVNDKRYIEEDDSRAEFVEKVREAVKSGNVDAVSFPDKYYNLVNQCNVDVDYLAWYTHNDHWFDAYLFKRLRVLKDDERVKGILFKDTASVER